MTKSQIGYLLLSLSIVVVLSVLLFQANRRKKDYLEIEIQDDLTGINLTASVKMKHKWITNYSQSDKAGAIKYAKEQGYKNLIEGAPKPGKFSVFSLTQWGLKGLYGERDDS